MIRIVACQTPLPDTKTIEGFQETDWKPAAEQDPVLVSVLYGHEKLFSYLFYEESKLIGYVILRIRKSILAEVFQGPVLIDPALYLSSVHLLTNQLRKKGLLVLRIQPPEWATVVPGIHSHFQWATAVVELQASMEQIFASFRSNHRYSIRQAMRQGLEVGPLGAKDLDDYIEGHKFVYQKRGLLHNQGSSHILRNQLLKILDLGNQHGMILGIRDQETGVLQAGGLFLRSGSSMIYQNGFSLRTNGRAYSHLIQWKAMEQARSLGCKSFDLHGYSLKPDAQLVALNDFKRWFGTKIHYFPACTLIGLLPGIKWLLKLMAGRL